MKLWNSDLGIWYLLKTRWLTIHGTTPTNADVWSLDIDTPWYSVWVATGLHASTHLWKGDKIVWFLERNDPDCTCYACMVSMRNGGRMTKDEAQILNDAINDPNRTTRKLASRRTDGA